MDNLIRLQKYIAECGIASRRGAEELIAQGRVKVNGETVSTQGVKVTPCVDVVEVNDTVLFPEGKKYYVMLNKPVGYVSTVKDQFNRDNVVSLVKDIPARLYPVGRLDYDSEGLLILTNDGDLTYRITHPSHELYKTYRVVVAGKINGEATELIRRGIDIDGKITLPAKVEVVQAENDKSTLNISIREGRNRQVRKMCAAAGYKVRTLKRIAIGRLELGNLATGKYRELTADEVGYLKSI